MGVVNGENIAVIVGIVVGIVVGFVVGFVVLVWSVLIGPRFVIGRIRQPNRRLGALDCVWQSAVVKLISARGER